MEKDVIIIKGAPGSGKSETAKALSKHFEKGIRMEVDTIRSMVISVNWTNQQEHINMLQIASDMTLNFLNFNYKPIIIVDTFSGDKVKSFTEHLYNSKKDISISIFALYVNEEELKQRLELRTNDMYKNYEVCKKLNIDVIKIIQENTILIDTTGKTAEKTASEIFNKL